MDAQEAKRRIPLRPLSCSFSDVDFMKTRCVLPHRLVHVALALGTRPVHMRELIQPRSLCVLVSRAFLQLLVRCSGLPGLLGSLHLATEEARVEVGLAVRAREQSLTFLIQMLHSSGARHFFK